MTQTPFEWHAKVRHYEIGETGIVGNGTIMNYFEQARIDYVASLGIHFSDFAKAGFSFVVSGYDVKFIRPLFNSYDFHITIAIEKYNDKRMSFNEKLICTKHNKCAASCLSTVACVDNETKRACMPEKLLALLPEIDSPSLS
jgi:acyl-CoA thioester hydrolase